MKEESYRICKSLYSEIEEVYPELYEEVFEEPCELIQIPSYVYMCFSGEKCIGMIATYIQNINTIYMQVGGIKKESRGFKSLEIFRKTVDMIHEDFDNIICRVHNRNFTALKLMLAIKMIIIGVRLDGEVLFVEFMKVKEK